MKENRCHHYLNRFSGIGIYIVFFAVLLLTDYPAVAETKPDKLTTDEQRVLYGAQEAVKIKDYATAEKLLSSFIKQQSGTVHYRVEFALGNTLAMAGKTEAALHHYRAATDLYPADAAVWQNMGKVCYELEKYKSAGNSLVRAYELMTPKSPRLSYQAAVAYMLAGKSKIARPLLERLVSGDKAVSKPVWVEALLKVYLDLGHKKKALKLVRGLLKKEGDQPKLWRILTRLYADRGDYKNAAAALSVYSSLTSVSQKEIKLLGDLYQMAHVPLKAARQYEKIIAKGGTKPVDYEKTASAYMAAHYTEKAMGVLTRGLNHQPTSTMWQMLGSIHYEKEAYQKAYEAFKKCAQIDLKNAVAHLMMGYCALQLDKMPTAKDAFIQATRFPGQRKEAERMLQEINRLQTASSKEVIIKQ
jgi:tetratricopeptide (TPR) repeat protein